MKLLNAVGRDAKGIFKWFVSSQGQAVVHAVETVVEVADPALTEYIDVVNRWMAEIAKTQAIAFPAGAESGLNDGKAAMTIGAMEPVILDYIARNKLPAPTYAKLKLINDSLVQVWNVLEKP